MQIPRDPQLEGSIHAPDFPEAITWLNSRHPLSLDALKGKVVLLDFWTFCCINCLHVLPELKALEQKYPEELVVIGVHSGKFTNEAETDAIQAAIERYSIEHPVINDRDYEVWKSYGIRAWPSFMLVNPIGRIIGTHSNEGIFKLFDTMISKTIQYFDTKGDLNRKPVLARPRDQASESTLSYPGKVRADHQNQRLYVSDSGHNQVILTDLDGQTLETIGSGASGLEDGGFEHCQFHDPQGIVRIGNFLYVCDTGNHAIRAMDLEKRVVTTVFGTGQQARMPNVSGRSTDVRLNSPWDITAIGDNLYIAMAGPHQIWHTSLRTLDTRPFAGSGREDLVDDLLADAALAQPSGITTDGANLYFADSEVSAIRVAERDPAGRVATLIGKGLFDFGDTEGDRETGRLQHPLGVAYSDDQLYIADTYNHRIKRLDLQSGQLTNLTGTGQPGDKDGQPTEAAFNEPSGVSVAEHFLYIADTNNHRIRKLDTVTGEVSTLEIH